MFYKEICKPRPSDYNRNGKLSYESILQILENAAGNHSANSGDSIAEANKNGIAWILIEWRVKIVRRPENGEPLNITTWVRGKAPASAVYRDFLLTDENGAEVLRAEAKFALFDLAASRLTRISEELFGAYQPEEKRVFEDAQRVRAPSEYSFETELQLRHSDIDFNGHVHNTRYVDLAMEVLPKEIFSHDDFTEVHVLYYKPVLEDSVVKAQYYADGSSHSVTIYADKVCCSLVQLK
ncbi:MAG: thioesterase [Candidatus Borkfalkiaceae bacterium]|nr:thioesterase [Christensenellaceae bacterium]